MFLTGSAAFNFEDKCWTLQYKLVFIHVFFLSFIFIFKHFSNVCFVMQSIGVSV